MPRKKKIEKIKYTSLTERRAYLKKIMGDMNKKYGMSVINYGEKKEEAERIPFGIPAIDEILGGGIPKGNFTTIWGTPASGKSTLAYYLVAQAQKLNKIVYYIALEPYDRKRMELFGINLKDLIIGEFPIAEQALDSIVNLSNEGVVDIIILDSIHSLAPKAKQMKKSGKLKSLEDDTMAVLARKLSDFFPIATDPVKRNKVAILLIGQTRTNIGGFIAFETLSGGNALSHYSKLIIHLRRGQKVDAPTEKVKESTVDEEGFEKKKTITKIIGFDSVIKIDKTQITGTKEELTKIHIPYYFKTGYTKPKEEK